MGVQNGTASEESIGVRLVYAPINLGEIPYFGGEVVLPYTKGDAPVRGISYHVNSIIDEFPLLFCPSNIEVSLEINLFMCHRYLGKFGSPKRGRNDAPVSGCNVKTVKSLANSFRGYLAWLTENDIGIQEIYLVADSEKTKPWLPPYRYQSHLISRVKAGEISWATGNRYLNHVRLFYEWALMTRRTDRIPFKYRQVFLGKQRKDGDVDFLYDSPIYNKKFKVQTSDLTIPKKYKSKVVNRDTNLMPFVTAEIDLLFKSKYMQQASRRLWVELALICGCRADEVATFPEDLVVNPSLSDVKVYQCKITGKFNKERTIMIPRFLMISLNAYKNSHDRLIRAAKWDMHYGTVKHRPLFINRSGRLIYTGSLSNIMPEVRKELKKSGITFKRKYHDLRSTFATMLCKFMLEKNLPEGFMRHKLMTLMGHENYSTTLKYISFARNITFESQMQDWVDSIYADLKPVLEKEAEDMAKKVPV